VRIQKTIATSRYRHLTIFLAMLSAAALGANAVRNIEEVTAVVANAVHIT